MRPDFQDSSRPGERDAAAIWDMLECGREVVRWLEGTTETEFASDPVLRFAVERSLTIIGEAARRVSEEFRASHPSVPWRRIIGLRNVLVHDYADVSPARIWLLARRDLPPLLDLLSSAASEGTSE